MLLPSLHAQTILEGLTSSLAPTLVLSTSSISFAVISEQRLLDGAAVGSGFAAVVAVGSDFTVGVVLSEDAELVRLVSPPQLTAVRAMRRRKTSAEISSCHFLPVNTQIARFVNQLDF
jgi:hypothetical protein